MYGKGALSSTQHAGLSPVFCRVSCHWNASPGGAPRALGWEGPNATAGPAGGVLVPSVADESSSSSTSFMWSLTVCISQGDGCGCSRDETPPGVVGLAAAVPVRSQESAGCSQEEPQLLSWSTNQNCPGSGRASFSFCSASAVAHQEPLPCPHCEGHFFLDWTFLPLPLPLDCPLSLPLPLALPLSSG